MKYFPAVVNRILRYIQNHEVKGKYRWYMATKLLLSNFVIKHKVGSNEFIVPYDQWCFWKNYGPNNYYLAETIPFFEVLNNELDNFDFVDLGADVGVVSALAYKHCPKLSKTIALEPNPYSFRLLDKNSAYNENQFIALNYAISNFNGTCQLNFQDNIKSDHEGFIDASKKGSTKVVTLDYLNCEYSLTKQLAIKIDVEGQELAVFEGGKDTIIDCDKLVVFIELHPDTLKRDNLQPEDIFCAAEKIRKFKWLVPLLGNELVDREMVFFEQFPIQQYDVIGIAV